MGPTRAEHVSDDDPFATTVVARPEPKGVLSSRELEVLTSVAAGLSDKQVAGLLGISPKTVRNHMTGIFTKLGAANRLEAVLKALKAGLLTI